MKPKSNHIYIYLLLWYHILKPQIYYVLIFDMWLYISAALILYLWLQESNTHSPNPKKIIILGMIWCESNDEDCVGGMGI